MYERLSNQLQLARDTVGDTASDLASHAMGFGVPLPARRQLGGKRVLTAAASCAT